MRERLTRCNEPQWEPVAVSQSGFAVGTRLVEWAWVESVAAFKRDMLTLEDVWFQLEGAGDPVMVCEDQPGFAEWERKLCERFPSVVGWRERVIQPPFAENFTVLYRRT